MSKATYMDAHGSHKVEELYWKLGGQPIGANKVEGGEHVQAPSRKNQGQCELASIKC